MSGTATSVAIVIVCVAGVAALARFQAREAALGGVPYWQRWRVMLVGAVLAIGLLFALIVGLILVLDPGR